jgi:hypothetical protein
MLRQMYREFAETEVKPLAAEVDERSASRRRPSKRWPSWA